MDFTPQTYLLPTQRVGELNHIRLKNVAINLSNVFTQKNVINKFEKAYAKSDFMFKLKIIDLATGERRIVTINERSN